MDVFGLDEIQMGDSTNTFLSETHSSLKYDDGVMQRVYELLVSPPAVQQYNSHSIITQEEHSQPIQFLPIIAGSLQSSEQETHDVLVNSASEVSFLLNWYEGDIGLSLTSPSGVSIDPDTDNASIFYMADQELLLKGYTIINPESGNWSVNITAIDIPGVSANYTITTLIKSDITISVELQKDASTPPEDIIVKAELSDGQSGIQGASVNATMRKPDGIDEPLVLYDDGSHFDGDKNDGVYANLYTGTDMFGMYTATMLASCSINGSQFERFTTSTIWLEQYPDLALSSDNITFSDSNPNMGDTVTINATVCNIGDAMAANASIDFYYGEWTEENKIGTYTANISANSSIDISMSWTAVPGEHEIYAVINPYNTFTETEYVNNSAFRSIYVNDIPHPVIEFSPVSSVSGQTIIFDGTDSYDTDGNITSWEWVFSDGSDQSGEIVSHVFTEPGQYDVILTVTDNLSATSSINSSLTVSPYIDLEVDFSANSTEILVDDPIRFNNSTIGGLTPYAYSWDFNNDGITDSVEENPEYLYENPGVYTITLHVTDSLFNTVNLTKQDYISVILSGTYPLADAGGPYTGIIDTPVSFNGTGSSDPDGTIISYDWDFGDNTTGSGVNPSHTYTAPGTYTVTLTVTDDEGLTDTDITSATINEQNPMVGISMTLQGGGRPDPEEWEIPITVKFFSPIADVMNDIPFTEFHLTTTKSDGAAICQSAMAPGTYDVTVVSEHTLTNVRRDVTISLPSTSIDMGTLLEGDADNDGIVNISDFGILAVSFGKMDGEPGYDDRADFDRNGIINISDFGLLAVDFMKMSPIEITEP
jgi:PKD repeat protein